MTRVINQRLNATSTQTRGSKQNHTHVF